ncbi:MAG: hypothetical protein ABII90_02075 [Bacteroidota bacterium]
MKCKILFAIFLTFYVLGTSASDIIWLSNTPPEKIAKEIRHGMHSVSYIIEKDGTEKKILWIRSGRFPVESKYTDSTNTKIPETFVLSPDGKLIKGELAHSRIGYVLTYEGNIEGFYNSYLTEKFIQGDTLYIMAAKAEVLSHKCSKGHAGIQKKMPPNTLIKHIPFEIVRKRISGEDFHTYLTSGDDITLKVFLNGEPSKGLIIMLSTQKKWTNNLTTDINGEATFQLIGDYYSKWKELNKRKIHNFLLVAEHTVTANGSYQGVPYKHVHYTGTLSGKYIPSKTMYTSYVYGFILFIFVIAITSILIFFYRRRRRKLFNVSSI